MADQANGAEECAESRLLGAGFSRRLEWWVPPGEDRALRLEDAIAALESGEIVAAGIALPDEGVRALPDELVDRIGPPPGTRPEPPPWLLAQAEVIAEATVEKMKPLIRAEVRAGLRAANRPKAKGPSK